MNSDEIKSYPNGDLTVEGHPTPETWLRECAYQLAIANEREAEKGTPTYREALLLISNRLRQLATTDDQIFGTIGRKRLLDLANEADKL